MTLKDRIIFAANALENCAKALESGHPPRAVAVSIREHAKELRESLEQGGRPPDAAGKD